MRTTNVCSGMLDQRITLRKPASSTDGFNNPEKTFADVETVWGQVEQGGGREFYAAETPKNEKRIRVKIRWRTDIDTTWRFVWNGRTFRIVDIDEIIRRKGLVLYGTATD